MRAGLGGHLGGGHIPADVLQPGQQALEEWDVVLCELAGHPEGTETQR